MTLTSIVATVLVLTACGGGSEGDDVSADVTTSTTASKETAAPTPSTEPPTSEATTTITEAASEWREQVAVACDGAGPLLAAITPNDGTAASIAAEAIATKAVFDAAPWASIVFPSDVQATADRIAAMSEDALGHLDTSIGLAGAGDTEAAQRELDEGFDRLARSATAWAMAGARCGPADPERAQNADLTVPLAMHSWQLNSGFGSIWVSEFLADRVVRLDPDTGEVQATIDVGDAPFKLQPADGVMWVRTAGSYVAVDPVTNSVTRTLAKPDVGPAANRSWALDGAMWICDGSSLHRYDPTTVARDATIELPHDCGSVYATEDLAVAWNYNEDAGESGSSTATFVDPSSNTPLATVALPVDVSGPAVLDDSVFFAGYGGSTAAVVDRSTWTVSATPDLGVAAGGTGQVAFDGASIYVVTADHQDVLQVDSTTFAVTDIIEPLGVNAVIVDDGAVWVAREQPIDAVQRFDVSRQP
jgi:hypothetical protein